MGKTQVGFGSLYLSDGTHSFGAAFPKHQPLVYMQIFWGFDEAKVHRGFVPCPQAVLVHAENCGCLTDAATMHCECKAKRLSAARPISGTSFGDTSDQAPHPTAKTVRVTQLPLFHPQKEHA